MSDPLRVAYVDYVCEPDKPGTTGLSDLVWDMARRVTALGDDVHVVAPYTIEQMPDPAVTVDRFPLPPIAYRNIAGHILIVLAALRKLREIGPFEVIHVPEYLSGAILASRLPDTPVVMTEPGNIFERVARGNPYDPATTLVFKLAARRAAKRCAKLVATSAGMADWWTWTGFTQDRIARVPLGIDTALFNRVGNAREQLGLDAEAPTLVYAARLSRENGADVLLEALPALAAAVPSFRLHVLGRGPLAETLEARAIELGLTDRVSWHGWVDFATLPAWYSAADAFVFSGRSGGTPRVLIQAMACGAPAVASAIDGITDHIRHEQTGLLFPSGDTAALASALERILTDASLRQRLGPAGAEYSRTDLDWNVLVKRIRSEVYQQVAGR